MEPESGDLIHNGIPEKRIEILFVVRPHVSILEKEIDVFRK